MFRKLFSRAFSIAPLRPNYTEGERKIHEKLANILQATELQVTDISGGCGSMFSIDITSPKFKGITLLKQHRMVSDVLQEEIKLMHGIQIKTHSPK